MIESRWPRKGHRAAGLGCWLGLFAATIAGERAARADVTSWFAAAGGATALQETDLARRTSGTLALEMGTGTSAGAPIVVGGLLKSFTLFGNGTDLALAARLAMGSYVRGGFGLAVDIGPYQRWWGPQSTGVLGQVVIGAPLGFQASVFTEQGSHAAHAYGVMVGIDLLRLTVYRTTQQALWYNPILPADVAR